MNFGIFIIIIIIIMVKLFSININENYTHRNDTSLFGIVRHCAFACHTNETSENFAFLVKKRFYQDRTRPSNRTKTENYRPDPEHETTR